MKIRSAVGTQRQSQSVVLPSFIALCKQMLYRGGAEKSRTPIRASQQPQQQGAGH